MTSKSAIVIFGYKDYKDDPAAGKHCATCKFCKQTNVITEKKGTTSGFVRHLRRCHEKK